MKIRNNIQTGLNTYASYSVAGLVNQNLSGVNTTRLKLTGNTSYNFGTASTSSPYFYIVEAGTYSFNLGTYSNYKVLPSDFPAIGSTGSGLTGSFTLDGLFDGSSMWIKSQLGFFDMPKPPAPAGPTGGGDADATAYLAAVVSAGGTVDGTITTAVNTLFTSLKSNSLYTKIDVMYPFIGQVAASNAINAKTPAGSFNMTWYGGMTFSTNGAIGNGTDGYGNTNFNASVSGSALDYSWGVYIYNKGNFGGEFFINGAYDGANVSTIRGDSATDIRLYGYTNTGSGGSITVPADNKGLYIITFDSTTTKSIYFNYDGVSPVAGSFSTTDTPALSNQPIYSHTLNINGSPYNYCNATTSFLYFGKCLTSGQVLTLSSIINTFQTSLGRNTY